MMKKPRMGQSVLLLFYQCHHDKCKIICRIYAHACLFVPRAWPIDRVRIDR